MATRERKNMRIAIGDGGEQGPPKDTFAQGTPSGVKSPKVYSESDWKILQEAASILGVSVPDVPNALRESTTEPLRNEQEHGHWAPPPAIPPDIQPAPLTSSLSQVNSTQYDTDRTGVSANGDLHDNPRRWNGNGHGAGDERTASQWSVLGGGLKEFELQMGFGTDDDLGDYDFDASALLYPNLDIPPNELDSAQQAPEMVSQDASQYPYTEPQQPWDDSVHTRVLGLSRQTNRSLPAPGLSLDVPGTASVSHIGMEDSAMALQLVASVQLGESGHSGIGGVEATMAQPVASSNPVDVESRKRKRTAFKDPQKRRQTGETRKSRACVRCHMQQIRCEPGEDPRGPCHRCTKLSGPTFSRLPCLRYRITDASLFAKGDHPRFIWTHRWKSMAIVEIAEWQSTDIKEVAITQDVGGTCYNIQVREFIPEPGDSLAREWSSGGVPQSYQCAPYAIANMHETARRLEQFVNENVVNAIGYYTDETDQLIRDTYVMARRYSIIAPTTQERQLLQDVLRLWNAVRMESRSDFICSNETLGMAPQDWDSMCNNYGHVLVPPVISAQIQLLMTVKVMQPLKCSVLRTLQIIVKKNEPNLWFTIYLCVFILLHSCALLTSHENRRAKKSGLQSRYVTNAFVEELHQGANIMLAFFHYCNKGGHPFAIEFWNSSCHVAMAELDNEQLDFLRTTSERIRKKAPFFKEIREGRIFENDYYFLAQLFDVDWKPTPTI